MNSERSSRGENMLKFLTQKLRTHSINENSADKVRMPPPPPPPLPCCVPSCTYICTHTYTCTHRRNLAEGHTPGEKWPPPEQRNADSGVPRPPPPPPWSPEPPRPGALPGAIPRNPAGVPGTAAGFLPA